MNEMTVTRGTEETPDPVWQSLYEVWLENRKPGYITLSNGAMYRVLRPSDEDIQFQPMGGIDNLYGSQSR